MAKHRKRRRKRRGRYIRGAIDLKIDVGTLAAQTLAAQVNGDVVTERTLLSSIMARYNLGQFTVGAGVGPLIFGVAHSDYTAAEIEEFIEQSGSWNEGDKISQEVGRRKIKIVGQFDIPFDGTNLNLNYDHGKKVYTRLGWILTTGQTFDLFIYNQGEAAFATTDPDVSMLGHANLYIL